MQQEMKKLDMTFGLVSKRTNGIQVLKHLN